MTNRDRYIIAYRLTCRASTGLSFIENHLECREITDPADLRSIYILFSFYFELLLKSRAIMLSNVKTPDELKSELQELTHKLDQIGNSALGKKELEKIGILSIRLIKQPFKKYIIKTASHKSFEIDDFTDVRYDFFPDKDGRSKLRQIKNQEQRILQKNINEAFKILKMIKEQNEREANLR